MIFTCRNNLTMGSVLFTSVRNAGRPHLFLFLISSLLLLVTGCEVAETDSAGNSTGGFTSLGNQRYFANEVALTVETSTEPLPQQSVRGQFRPEEVRQRVKTPTGDKEVPLDGDGVNNLIAYAPIDLEKSNFGPVYNLDLIPTSGNSFGSSSGSRTLVWTVPEYDPETDPVLFTAFGKSGVLTGRSVTIQEQWSFSNFDKINPDDENEEPVQKDPPVVTVQISGVDFEDGSSSFGGRVRYQFSSTIPGLHTVENHVVHSDGAEGDGSWSYYQRRMEFAEEFPEYDDSTTDPVEINNTIIWDDGSPVNDAEWGVGVGDESKQGTGSEIAVVWKPLEEVLEQYVDPATVPVEETLEPTPLSVQARAPVFSEEWDNIGPVYYTIIGGTDVPRRPVLKIKNEQIEPTEPFTEGNNYANVLADIIFFNPDIMQSDIHWQVDVKNSAGEVVWEKLATGTGWDIAASWDGTLQGGPLPADDNDPTTYVFGLSAFLCDDDGGVVVTGRALDGVNPQALGDEDCSPDPQSLAQLDVPIVENTGVVEIFADDDSLVASSNAYFPALSYSDFTERIVFGAPAPLRSRGTLGFGDRGNNNFMLKIPGNEMRLRLVVSDVEDSESLDSVIVKVRTTESSSGASRNIALYKSTHPTTGDVAFVRDIFLAEANSGGADPRFAIEPFQESFATFDATVSGGRIQDSERFAEIQGEIGRKRLGRSLQWPPEGPDYSPDTGVSVDAFRAAGYESLIASIGGQQAWVRVRNQAKLFYVSAHGLHDANYIRFGPSSSDIIYPSSDLSDPQGLAREDWENDKLETVIFAACSVLDLGNWNDGHHGKQFGNYDPGRAWVLLTKPETLILGYNSQAPDAEETTADLERRDTRILERFYEQINVGDAPVIAWLRGNSRMETRLGDNASAVLGNYYYFIKFKRKSDWIGSGYTYTDREIWKVHANYWDGKSYFEDIPENEKGKILIQVLPDQEEGEDRGIF